MDRPVRMKHENAKADDVLNLNKRLPDMTPSTGSSIKMHNVSTRNIYVTEQVIEGAINYFNKGPALMTGPGGVVGVFAARYYPMDWGTGLRE